MLFPQELERFSQNSFSHTAAAAAARSTAHMLLQGNMKIKVRNAENKWISGVIAALFSAL